MLQSVLFRDAENRESASHFSRTPGVRPGAGCHLFVLIFRRLNDKNMYAFRKLAFGLKMKYDFYKTEGVSGKCYLTCREP